MKKINFKQPKYIFPAIIFIPLVFIVYYACEMFGGEEEKEVVQTNEVNPNLPDAQSKDVGDKMSEMQMRFRDDDEAFSAVGELGQELETKESLDNVYSEDELNRIDAAEAERLRQQKELEQLERNLAESRRHINTQSASTRSRNSYRDDDVTEADYVREMQEMQMRAAERQRMLNRALGLDSKEREEAMQRRQQDSIARARKLEYERNRPQLVIKSKDSNSERFNSVNGMENQLDSPLIRAMIDQTTKAHEGTRIRFKLLDNVTIKDVRLPKGTYLYGTVSGFSQQRVMAKITSILVGNRFIKVDLSVFDNDGMEGFYVPQSAFRDFMKQAGASTAGQQIQFDNGGSAGGLNGETLALQALQNVYNSASSAVSANIRKNRAKIKYNTVVYLINSKDAR